MDKIFLTGTKTIYLADNDKIPEPDIDYYLTLVVSRDAVKVMDLHGETGSPDKVYVMKVLYPERLLEKGKSIVFNIKKSKSQSQVLRWTIEDLAEKLGQDKEKFYKAEMSKIISHYKEKLT